MILKLHSMKNKISILSVLISLLIQTTQSKELNYIYKSGESGYKSFRIPAMINRNTISKIASISSFTLFILGWSISWFGPEDYFEHNTITLTLTGFFSILAHILALSITLAYFVSKWIYQAIQRIRS